MGRASASPAASRYGNRAAPRTSSFCSRSAHQSRTDGPQPARSNLQFEPHVAPSRIDPRPSSLALARIRQRLANCRIFTPAPPNHSAASVRDFCSGAYIVNGITYNVTFVDYSFGTGDITFNGDA